MNTNFSNESQGQSQVSNGISSNEIVLPNGATIRREDLKLYGYTELSIKHQSGFMVKNFDLTKHLGFDELISTFGEEMVREFCSDHKYGEDIKSDKLKGVFKFVWFGLLARKNGKYKKGKFKS